MIKSLSAGAVLLALALQAQAALVDQATAIPAPAVLIDFEAWEGLITAAPLAVGPGITFVGDAGSEIGAYVRDLGENGVWGVGNHFVATASADAAELRFQFTQPSAGAGAFVNHHLALNETASVVVTAYGQGNQVLESHTISLNTGWESYNAGAFYGIVRSQGDIQSLSFRGFGVVVDDLRVSAVPEPQTYLAMLAGLAVVARVVRRRRVAL